MMMSTNITKLKELKALKQKHSNVCNEKLTELLVKYVKCRQEIWNEENQQLKENETKIQTLLSILADTEKVLRNEREALQQKNEELAKYDNIIAELQMEHTRFLDKIQLLNTKRDALKQCKPNYHDQLLMEQGRKKFNLYKKLTGISWDYSTLKDEVKGYVCNGKDYIHHFSYENEEDPHKISDLLWHEIYLSTDLGKENNEKENIT